MLVCRSQDGHLCNITLQHLTRNSPLGRTTASITINVDSKNWIWVFSKENSCSNVRTGFQTLWTDRQDLGSFSVQNYPPIIFISDGARGSNFYYFRGLFWIWAALKLGCASFHLCYIALSLCFSHMKIRNVCLSISLIMLETWSSSTKELSNN